MGTPTPANSDELRGGECYIDTSARLLKHFKDLGGQNSPDNCQQYCTGQNFIYSGVQYTSQCFCGNDNPADTSKAPASECNAVCPGDSTKKCGGTWRMNIYLN